MNNLLIFTTPVVHALGLTLVHSVWQGLLTALILWFVLPKIQTSITRYRFAMSALFGLFFAAVGTFFYFFETEKTMSILTDSGQFFEVSRAENTLFEAQNTTAKIGFFQKIQLWFDANHAILVGLWMLGALFFFLKLVGGWILTERLKTVKTTPILADFEEILAELRQKMAISRPVRLLESGLAAVPMTIGWLKPVILFPVGLVNYLTISEVEAVLAHELAHIARRDWLFNILQSFVEVAFYFHPAVWWISEKIRVERENVADDFALQILENEPIEYVKTLVRVQEMTLATPNLGFGTLFASSPTTLALAFSEKQNLLSRVRRILFQQPNHKNSAMEKMIATGMLIALAACFSLRADSAAPIAKRFSEIISSPNSLFETDSISPEKTRGTGQIMFIEDGKSVKINYKNGEILHLEINGQQIPTSDFEKYNRLIAESLANVPTPPTPPDIDFPEPPTPPEIDHIHGSGFYHISEENSDLGNLQMIGTMHLDELSDLQTTDAQGRSHLKIQQDGQVHELIFEKNGSAILNGKPLKNGEKQSIFPKNDENDFIAMVDGQVFQLNNGELLWNPNDPEIRQNMETQLRIARAENRKLEAENRQMERENHQQERENRANERTAEADARTAEADARTADADSEVTSQQNFHYDNYSNDGDETSWLTDQLRRDNFDLKHYSVELTSKKLKINGKKQSDDRQRLYFQRYCREGGGSATSTFSCSHDED
jgi:bla regulator protein blaR1